MDANCAREIFNSFRSSYPGRLAAVVAVEFRRVSCQHTADEFIAAGAILRRGKSRSTYAKHFPSKNGRRLKPVPTAESFPRIWAPSYRVRYVARGTGFLWKSLLFLFSAHSVPSCFVIQVFTSSACVHIVIIRCTLQCYTDERVDGDFAFLSYTRVCTTHSRETSIVVRSRESDQGTGARVAFGPLTTLFCGFFFENYLFNG